MALTCPVLIVQRALPICNSLTITRHHLHLSSAYPALHPLLYTFLFNFTQAHRSSRANSNSTHPYTMSQGPRAVVFTFNLIFLLRHLSYPGKFLLGFGFRCGPRTSTPFFLSVFLPTHWLIAPRQSTIQWMIYGHAGSCPQVTSDLLGHGVVLSVRLNLHAHDRLIHTQGPNTNTQKLFPR